MLSNFKITPIFALLTFREEKLAHQASFSRPLGLGGHFCFQWKEVVKMDCIICGDPVEHPSQDFCDRCWRSSIDELEERYLKKEAPETREDHQEA